MFHELPLEAFAQTLCAVLRISGSLSRLNLSKASKTLLSSLGGDPSHIICRILDLIRTSTSSTISNTLFQKSSISSFTLQGHN